VQAFFASEKPNQINIGFGSDITIAQMARAVSNATGYQGNIDFDTNQPDGSPRKLMDRDSTRLNTLGWQAKINLEQGLTLARQDFMQQISC
jgi:GDP-L-fucose synthase